MDNQLNEKLGGIHPGVFARVRFRKVGALRIGPPSVESLFNSRQGVVNFAEAERRRKPFIAPVQLPVENLPVSVETVSSRKQISTSSAFTSESKKPPLAYKLPSIDLSKDSSASFQHPAVANVPAFPVSGAKNLPRVNLVGDSSTPRPIPTTLNMSPAPATKKHTTLVKPPTTDLFGDSSSSESDSTTSSPDFAVQAPKKSNLLNKIPPAELFGDSSTSESEGEQQSLAKESSRSANRTVTKKSLCKPLHNVPSELGIIPTRRERTSELAINSTESTKKKVLSVPDPVTVHVKTQPMIVASSGTRIVKEAQPELISSSGSATFSDNLKINLDPLEGDQRKKRITRASKRSLESDNSAPSCWNPTPTKKARAPLEEHTPSPFSPYDMRSTLVVNKSYEDEVIRPLPGANVTQINQPSVVSIHPEPENKGHPHPDNSSGEIPLSSVQDDLMESSASLAGSSTEKCATLETVVEEIPASPEDFESPQSPDDVGAPMEDTVVQIPTNDEPQFSAFEIASKVPKQNSFTPHKKAPIKLRKVIHLSINKYTKVPEINAELLAETVDHVLRPDSIRDPSIFIRHLMSTVIKDADNLLDLSMTPPAPPLTGTQQRCIILIKVLDEKRVEIDLTKTVKAQFYSDAFLNEVSSFMFQTNSALTLEEMCALARTFTALARSRGLMSQARSFLYDCLYFFPHRSFALTYTILSVWTEVLRHVSFPTGLTAMDHTVAYLLLQCCKVKAVSGVAGKVTQLRSFMKSTLGHQNSSCTAANELVVFLVSQLSKSHSVDETSSIHWSLCLLVRWEGVDLAINIIEKHLWPFLQKWSAGDGTNAGAASAIKCIGALGKTVPTKKRAGVKNVLGAMKTILNSEEADATIQEAAAEAVILLGEEEEPNMVLDVLKKWKPRFTPSTQLQKIMCIFLQRHSSQNN